MLKVEKERSRKATQGDVVYITWYLGRYPRIELTSLDRSPFIFTCFDLNNFDNPNRHKQRLGRNVNRFDNLIALAGSAIVLPSTLNLLSRDGQSNHRTSDRRHRSKDSREKQRSCNQCLYYPGARAVYLLQCLEGSYQTSLWSGIRLLLQTLVATPHFPASVSKVNCTSGVNTSTMDIFLNQQTRKRKLKFSWLNFSWNGPLYQLEARSSTLAVELVEQAGT